MSTTHVASPRHAIGQQTNYHVTTTSSLKHVQHRSTRNYTHLLNYQTGRQSATHVVIGTTPYCSTAVSVAYYPSIHFYLLTAALRGELQFCHPQKSWGARCPLIILILPPPPDCHPGRSVSSHHSIDLIIINLSMEWLEFNQNVEPKHKSVESRN